MNARQQAARLLPLAMLVLLTATGAGAGIGRPRWDGPLRADGGAIGVAVEVILAGLLAATYLRERSAATATASLEEDELDIAAALRLLLRALIGAAMIAVAVVLLVSLHLHLFRATAKLRPPPGKGAGRAQGAHFSSGRPVHIPLGPILYGLLVVALLAILAASIWWARRLGRPVAVAGPLPGGDEDDSAELRDAVASGRAAMASLDDARAAIIACYAAMEGSLAARGATRGAAGTPDELLRRVIDREIVRGPGARRLTAAFYEARYSTHPLGPDKRDAAIAALDELAAELDAVPAAVPDTAS
jgi:hypothetical protein